MKRIFTVILCSSLIFCLSACSKQDSSSSSKASQASENSPASESSIDTNNSKASETSIIKESSSAVSKYIDINKLTDKTAKIADILDGERVTLEAEGNISVAAGISVSFSAKLVKDGSKRYQQLSYSSMNSTTIVNDNGTYKLDENKKTAKLINKSDQDSESSTENQNSADDPVKEKMASYMSSSFNLDELTYKESGEEKYKGKSLSYEEYNAGDYIIKLYYDENTPVYLTVKKGTQKSEIEIKQLSAEADNSLFEIPSDYKIE